VDPHGKLSSTLSKKFSGFKDLSESKANEPANAVFAILETPPILELFLLESSAK